MEKRILNISFNKAGSGSMTKRLTLPSSILKKIGIDENNRQVLLMYDDDKNEIIIRKKD